MAETAPALRLTNEGAMTILNAAMAKADEMGVPQCISIVDAGGHLLAFARMDGAFVLSIDSSLMKAMTAASYGEPTGHIAEGVDLKLAIATQGKRVNLPGGAADRRRRPSGGRHRRRSGARPRGLEVAMPASPRSPGPGASTASPSFDTPPSGATQDEGSCLPSTTIPHPE